MLVSSAELRLGLRNKAVTQKSNQFRGNLDWSVDSVSFTGIELKSLILAQIERWRHALHMQVERQRVLRDAGEWRTGE